MNNLNEKYIIREDIESVTEFLEIAVPVLAEKDSDYWNRIIERFHLAMNDQ